MVINQFSTQHEDKKPELMTDDFEDVAYPTVNPDMRKCLREQRALVRAFLASEYGRTQVASTPKRLVQTRAALTTLH